jgi:hypothetical protein
MEELREIYSYLRIESTWSKFKKFHIRRPNGVSTASFGDFICDYVLRQILDRRVHNEKSPLFFPKSVLNVTNSIWLKSTDERDDFRVKICPIL